MIRPGGSCERDEPRRSRVPTSVADGQRSTDNQFRRHNLDVGIGQIEVSADTKIAWKASQSRTPQKQMATDHQAIRQLLGIAFCEIERTYDRRDCSPVFYGAPWREYAPSYRKNNRQFTDVVTPTQRKIGFDT
jgi:hypothetical protein